MNVDPERRNEIVARLECDMLDRRIRHLARRFVTERRMHGSGRGGRRGWKIATELKLGEERRADLRAFLDGDLSWDEATRRMFERLGMDRAAA